MRLRTKIFGAISAGSGLSLILCLFLPLFRSVEVDESGVNYGLFSDFIGIDTRFKALNKVFQPAFANMTSVLCVMALVLLGLFILCFVLQLFNVSFIPVRAILKAVSITLIMVAVIAVVCGIIFTSMNQIQIADKTVLSFKLSFGTYILIIFGLISGVSGLIAEWGYESY